MMNGSVEIDFFSSFSTSVELGLWHHAIPLVCKLCSICKALICVLLFFIYSSICVFCPVFFAFLHITNVTFLGLNLHCNNCVFPKLVFVFEKLEIYCCYLALSLSILTKKEVLERNFFFISRGFVPITDLFSNPGNWGIFYSTGILK